MKDTLKKIILFLSLFATLLFSSCASKKKYSQSIAVFATGILADSPIYQMMVEGVTNAVNEYNFGKPKENHVALSVIETGTNQAKWAAQLTALCATEKYDVIIASNPSMPDLALPLLEQFPNQKFIFLDAWCERNKNISTIRYRQNEQAYLTGYISGLMTRTGKIGLIAAQEYPVMNMILLPNYARGATEARRDSRVDFRVIGNWYDASKGAELADAMFTSGVDVILPICGGASQGVISSAKEHQFYITSFDSIGFEKAPGLVISSAIAKQSQLAMQVTLDYLDGKTEWGVAKEVGMKEGYSDFIQDDPLYIKTVPENIRKIMAEQVEKIKSGEITF